MPEKIKTPLSQKSVQKAHQWNVRVTITVSIVDAETGHYNYQDDGNWQGDIPLAAFGSVNFTPLVAAETTRAIENKRVRLAEEQAAEQGEESE